MWAVISSSLFRLRSCKHEKRLKVTARLTILHYFLDTVLEEESDEAAGSHNGSRPATRQRQTQIVWHLKARFAAFGAMADEHFRIGTSRAR